MNRHDITVIYNALIHTVGLPLVLRKAAPTPAFMGPYNIELKILLKTCLPKPGVSGRLVLS